MWLAGLLAWPNWLGWSVSLALFRWSGALNQLDDKLNEHTPAMLKWKTVIETL